MSDFDARSRSGHSGSGSGVVNSPEDRLVPATRTEARGTEAATPSPMHLSSFLGSPPESTPVPESSSSDSVMQPVTQVLSQTLHLHRHENVENTFVRQDLQDNRSIRQHLQLNQANLSVTADPVIVAQAAAEVNLARRQTQEVYSQASREIEATRASAQEEVRRHTYEVLQRASQEVDQSRALAEREVERARQVAAEARKSQEQSEHMLTFAQGDFQRLQDQVQSLMGVLELQKDIIHRLESERSQAMSPSNGTGTAPGKHQGTEATSSTNAIPLVKPPMPLGSPEVPKTPGGFAFRTTFDPPKRPPNEGTGGPETKTSCGNLPPVPDIYAISTPRAQIDPGIQGQLDVITAQITSLANVVASISGGSPAGGGNAPPASLKGAGATSRGYLRSSSVAGSDPGSAIAKPPGPPSDSSGSDSSGSGSGKGRKGGNASETGKRSSSSSSSSGSDGVYKKERKLMRTKQYDSLKIAALPKSASEFRGFRNHLYSAVTKLAKGNETPLLAWISKCNDATCASSFDDSGHYPLLDRILGHRMLEHARGTKFSMEFQSLQEKAQKHGKQPKGRLLLWVVFQRFRLEKDRGTALTQHHLLSLTVQGSEVKGLIEFRQRFDFVWEALEPSERPSDNAVRSLLFENLKGRPLMSLHIDRFRNSSSSSSKRTWEWLYGKMVDVVDIAQLEENTASISKALAGGNNRVAANAAPKAQAKEKAKPNNGDKSEQDKAKEKKEREKAKKKEKEKETKEKARAAATVATSEAATPAPAAPAKGKGKGKDKPKSPRAKEEKAKLPCMFFAYDCCTHGNACEYIHDKNNLYKGPKPRGIKASAGAATVAAGVAMASALPTAKGSCVEEWQCGNACPSEQESPKRVQGLAGRVKGLGKVCSQKAASLLGHSRQS